MKRKYLSNQIFCFFGFLIFFLGFSIFLFCLKSTNKTSKGKSKGALSGLQIKLKTAKLNDLE